MMRHLFTFIPLWFRTFGEEEKGTELVEYALVLGLVTAASVMALSTMGSTVSESFSNVANLFSEVIR